MCGSARPVDLERLGRSVGFADAHIRVKRLMAALAMWSIRISEIRGVYKV